MKISIITVVFNNEATIRCAIDSVNSQQYADIEHIIIDGASTDATLALIKANPGRTGIIVSEKDKGIYDAMNKGIQMATGDVIGILNSDDLYYDDRVLADVMKEFGEDNELDILYGDLLYVKSSDTDRIVRNWVSRPYYQRFFENGNVPPHPALFLRRRVYDEAGLFELKFKLTSDYEFMLRIFKKYNFKSKYINRIMVKMRLGGATNKSIANIVKGNIEILKAWKKNELHPPFYLMLVRVVKRLIQFVVKPAE